MYNQNMYKGLTKMNLILYKIFLSNIYYIKC